MDKGTKVMVIIWCVLAVINFCMGWWMPLYWAIPVLVFGFINISAVATFLVTAFSKKKNE